MTSRAVPNNYQWDTRGFPEKQMPGMARGCPVLVPTPAIIRGLWLSHPANTRGEWNAEMPAGGLMSRPHLELGTQAAPGPLKVGCWMLVGSPQRVTPWSCHHLGPHLQLTLPTHVCQGQAEARDWHVPFCANGLWATLTKHGLHADAPRLTPPRSSCCHQAVGSPCTPSPGPV